MVYYKYINKYEHKYKGDINMRKNVKIFYDGLKNEIEKNMISPMQAWLRYRAYANSHKLSDEDNKSLWELVNNFYMEYTYN